MYCFISRIACAAALLATPGLAHAGTSTGTGAASMKVVNQCSVTGANVNLGTFTTNNTWGDVGAQLGYFDGVSYNFSSQGASYANFGSVVCDAGTPYTLLIKGTSTSSYNGGVQFTINGKTVKALVRLKQIGAINLPDIGSFAGLGTLVSQIAASGTGTGSAQALMGNVGFDFAPGNGDVSPSEKLAVAGTYSDTLTYTLNF